MEDSGRSGMVVASRAYIVVVGLLDVGFFSFWPLVCR